METTAAHGTHGLAHIECGRLPWMEKTPSRWWVQGNTWHQGWPPRCHLQSHDLSSCHVCYRAMWARMAATATGRCRGGRHHGAQVGHTCLGGRERDCRVPCMTSHHMCHYECDTTRRDSPTKQGCPATRSGGNYLRPEGKPPSPMDAVGHRYAQHHTCCLLRYPSLYQSLQSPQLAADLHQTVHCFCTENVSQLLHRHKSKPSRRPPEPHNRAANHVGARSAVYSTRRKTRYTGHTVRRRPIKR